MNDNWEYFDGNTFQWTSDDTVQITCLLVCCNTVRLLSNGGLGQVLYPNLLGDYSKVDGTPIKPTYKHATQDEYLFYLKDNTHHWEGWMFRKGDNSTWGDISNNDDPDCPVDVQRSWDIFDGNLWIPDDTMTLTCV